MKKKVLIIFCIAIISLIAIIIYNKSKKSNINEIIISEVDLKNIDELMIGSEPPKLLYADKEKVIFDCSGVYVYDMKNQALTKSFDISSTMSKMYGKRIWNCFVSQDGKQIFFNSSKDTTNLSARYCYSFENDLVKEIAEKEYTDNRKNAFECTYLDYKDELYEKASGSIVNISDNEYVYLTFQDWKVSTIEIVYVYDGKETYYSVFDN